MEKKELSIWIQSVLCVKGVGRKTAWKVFQNLPEDISSRDEFTSFIEKASKQIKPRFSVSKSQIIEMIEKAEGIIEQTCSVKRGSVLNYSEFPISLRKMDDPPLLLHCLGNAELIGMPGTAVIGTREPTPHGEKAARQFGEILAQQDQVVVSGLALGCDTGGHIGCLEKSGKTIAVLAHGLDSIYPSQNRDLAKRILSADGLLVSEYSFGTSVRGPYFVERDRIQAGLSNQVIVVETGIKGGTLHTVGFAEKNGIPFSYWITQKNYKVINRFLETECCWKKKELNLSLPTSTKLKKLYSGKKKLNLNLRKSKKNYHHKKWKPKRISKQNFFETYVCT